MKCQYDGGSIVENAASCSSIAQWKVVSRNGSYGPFVHYYCSDHKSTDWTSQVSRELIHCSSVKIIDFH